ncbi:ATP synthase F0 subunit A [Paenibacillus swuensis]|uniref:ATP synthase subunit a n=1 Tax=Paenibacillus swuensis TaxID=1178515 RepID=A0A172THZ7_9BACL|nr:F0F1 ATP synthase subunit A [Paenibacillus swuensis]ANE46661.1 ATP synthase F0 subunit A [Paenibacillus swuensis]
MHEAPIIKLFGWFRLDLSVAITLLVTCAIVFIIARLATRNLSVTNPSRMQNFLEWAVDFVRGIVSSTMDMKKGKVFVSLGLTLIMFIFVANMLGLPLTFVTAHDHQAKFLGMEISPEVFEKYEAESHGAEGEEGGHGHHGPEFAWWKSPTADASVAMGLSLIVFLLVHYLGMTRNTKSYFKHYLEPFPVFLPIHLVEKVANLLTLGMRLFGNLFAGEVLIATLLGAGIYGIPALVVWQGFSVFVGSIQAFVFVMLTMVYLAQSLESHDDHH